MPGSRGGRLRRSEAASGYLLVSPTALYAILMLAAPMIFIIGYSLVSKATGEVTLANYTEVWSGRIYQAIMLRSLWVAMAVTAATVLLAYPVAYFVSFHVAPEKKSLWLFLITIPFWTSYVIRVYIWRFILGYDGVINSALLWLGIVDQPVQAFSYSVGAIVGTLAHAYAPFAILPIYVALEKIDRSLLEAGQDLGESKLRTFWRVTLPLSMPGVIAAVLIVFIPTIGDYVTPELIGGGKIPMIANMIEVKMLKQRDPNIGSAIAVTAMLIVAAVSIAFLLWNRRFLRGQK